MSWICLHCGAEFESPLRDYDYATGHFDDSCPNCGSEDIEEAAECEECGAVKSAETIERYDGLCEDCIREKAADLETAFRYGMDNKVTIEVNGLIASAWSTFQMEMELLRSVTQDDAVRYCMDDYGDFAYWLKQRRNMK